MAEFNPTDAFKSAWTARMVMHAEGNTLAYALGNNSSESEIQTNKDYKVADPTIEFTEETRERAASSATDAGALGDYTALTSDVATLEWITVAATGSRAFRGAIDKRDIDYVAPVTLGLLRQRMAQQVSRWIDQNLWNGVITNVSTATPDNTAELSGETNLALSLATGKPGGTGAQATTSAKSIIAWLDNLNLLISIADIDPGTSGNGGDTGIPVAVMPSPWFKLITDELLKEYDSTDLIVTQGLAEAPTIFGGGRWRGRMFGIDLYTTNRRSAVNTAAGIYPLADTATQATQRFRAIATIPQRGWDNAVKQYAVEYDPPNARSAKGIFAQELEVWQKVVEDDYVWMLEGDAFA